MRHVPLEEGGSTDLDAVELGRRDWEDARVDGIPSGAKTGGDSESLYRRDDRGWGEATSGARDPEGRCRRLTGARCRAPRI
uniref:Uncharacterized protein n=1 Tax=Oryza brachyantha TaxID=4533 RepID=J3MFN7_ORYBR